MQLSNQDHPFTPAGPEKCFIAAAAAIAAGLGLGVLIGWYAHLPAIVQLRPDLAPMQYNAALCILLSGAGLGAFNWGQVRLAQVLGGMAAVLTGLTLCEYLGGGRDLGIDQVFFNSYILTQTFHSGRMSPASTLCLLLIGMALDLAGIPFQRKWRAMALGSLGSVVIAVCVAAILGYVIDLPGTYAWSHFTRLALHTAVGMVFLGAGIFVIAWNDGRDVNEMTPRWLPVPLALAVLAISLVFSQALASKQNQGTAQATKAGSEAVQSIINLCMEVRIRSLERLARNWEFSGHSFQAAWENDSTNYARDFPDLAAMEWVDASTFAKWGGAQTGASDSRLEKVARGAAEKARQSRAPIVSHIVELFGGTPGFIVCVPVFTGARFDGCVAGKFMIRPLFDRYLPASVAAGYAISISQEGRTFYERYPSPEPANKDWVSSASIEQGETAWNLSVWPVPALAARLDSPVPQTLLYAGLIRATVLGLIVYLAQKSSAQARKTAILNHELQKALAEVRTLSGMLPICSGCKRIRDDSGYWNEIERYVTRHSGASFSHGICPECAKTFYEEEGLPVPDEVLKAIERHNYD